MKKFLLAALIAGSVPFFAPAASACHLTDPLNPGCWIHYECATLATLSPGVPGVVDITPEGDVYLTGELFYDCPPYNQ